MHFEIKEYTLSFIYIKSTNDLILFFVREISVKKIKKVKKSLGMFPIKKEKNACRWTRGISGSRQVAM